MEVATMINSTLYLREMKKSWKMLLIFAAVLTMYVSIIIAMYDPEMMKTLDTFNQIMPEMMAAFGMNGMATSLLGFMVSYLYGFILLIFPMVFSILRGNGLIAKYTENGAIWVLTAAPVRRMKIVCTQLAVLLSGVFLLMIYTTVLELIVAGSQSPDEFEVKQLLALNSGLISLQMFIAGICFLSSCIFSDTKYSMAFGAGIPAFMYVLKMLANVGEKTEAAKYFSFFTLFDGNALIAGETSAIVCTIVLFAGAVVMYVLGCVIFCRKDMAL